MKETKPIPISVSTWWRELRTRVLPLVVLVGAIGAMAVIWRNHTGQATLQGIGEGASASITAPQTVRIEKWLVEPHTIVSAGAPVAIVIPADARAEFDRLRTLYEVARIRSQPSPAEDNAMSFERVRIELLNTKAELAIARVKLEQAERDVQRNTPLFHEKLVSAEIYELSVNLRDALKAEVAERDRAVTQIEQRVDALRAIGEPAVAGATGTNVAWLRDLEQAQAAAFKNLEPQTLRAPITGMVGVPIRQAGEFVPAGEPLMMMRSTRADQVIAYLRQPYRFDPQIGMTARITTRTSERQAFASQITQVGAQVEILTNALAILRPGLLVDAALPVVLPVPPGIRIRPGEIVDVTITDSPHHSTDTSTSTSGTPRL